MLLNDFVGDVTFIHVDDSNVLALDALDVVVLVLVVALTCFVNAMLQCLVCNCATCDLHLSVVVYSLGAAFSGEIAKHLTKSCNYSTMMR